MTKVVVWWGNGMVGWWSGSWWVYLGRLAVLSTKDRECGDHNVKLAEKEGVLVPLSAMILGWRVAGDRVCVVTLRRVVTR